MGRAVTGRAGAARRCPGAGKDPSRLPSLALPQKLPVAPAALLHCHAGGTDGGREERYRSAAAVPAGWRPPRYTAPLVRS